MVDHNLCQLLDGWGFPYIPAPKGIKSIEAVRVQVQAVPVEEEISGAAAGSRSQPGADSEGIVQ